MMDHPLLGALAELAPVIDMHAHPPYDPAQVEPLLAAAWRAGIRRIILTQLGYSAISPYPTCDEVERGNQAVYDMIARHPGFVFGYVYVNPNLPETPAMLEDGLARPGVVGIKLWISCRDSVGRLDPVYPVLELAAARQTPVLIHAFYRTGGSLPGELSPTDIAHLAARFPAADRDGPPGRAVAPRGRGGAAVSQRLERHFGIPCLPGERRVRRAAAGRRACALWLRCLHPQLYGDAGESGRRRVERSREAAYCLGQQR